jgi:hypothetical protein
VKQRSEPPGRFQAKTVRSCVQNGTRRSPLHISASSRKPVDKYPTLVSENGKRKTENGKRKTSLPLDGAEGEAFDELVQEEVVDEGDRDCHDDRRRHQ